MNLLQIISWLLFIGGLLFFSVLIGKSMHESNKPNDDPTKPAKPPHPQPPVGSTKVSQRKTRASDEMAKGIDAGGAIDGLEKPLPYKYGEKPHD